MTIEFRIEITWGCDLCSGEDLGTHLRMLPHSALPSIDEKIKAHRDREKNQTGEDAIEEEKSAKFCRCVPRRKEQSYTSLLLGPEFDKVDGECDEAEACGDNVSLRLGQEGNESKKSPSHQSSDRGSHVTDWTVSPLSPSTLSMLAGTKSITISVPRARGGNHDVVLGPDTLRRLQGSSQSGDEGKAAVAVISWLDDNTIDGFMSLLNCRSENACALGQSVHMPSKNKDLFNRSKVRTFVFSSQFYTIWNRAQNGGYENVRRWRRKVPNYNSVGMYMFPAFVHNNHWVLAVIDVDGHQFIYYDPHKNPDRSGVMRCAKEWIEGEVETAEEGDPFKNLDISSWPVLYNPWELPLQLDSESCGVFVLYVAEHFDRGENPKFQQCHISTMRLRTMLILHQGKLQHDADPSQEF